MKLTVTVIYTLIGLFLFSSCARKMTLEAEIRDVEGSNKVVKEQFEYENLNPPTYESPNLLLEFEKKQQIQTDQVSVQRTFYNRAKTRNFFFTTSVISVVAGIVLALDSEDEQTGEVREGNPVLGASVAGGALLVHILYPTKDKIKDNEVRRIDPRYEWRTSIPENEEILVACTNNGLRKSYVIDQNGRVIIDLLRDFQLNYFESYEDIILRIEYLNQERMIVLDPRQWLKQSIVVTEDISCVHSDPSYSSRILTGLQKGSTVLTSGLTDNWWRLQAEDFTGYIEKNTAQLKLTRSQRIDYRQVNCVNEKDQQRVSSLNAVREYYYLINYYASRALLKSDVKEARRKILELFDSNIPVPNDNDPTGERVEVRKIKEYLDNLRGAFDQIRYEAKPEFLGTETDIAIVRVKNKVSGKHVRAGEFEIENTLLFYIDISKKDFAYIKQISFE